MGHTVSSHNVRSISRGSVLVMVIIGQASNRSTLFASSSPRETEANPVWKDERLLGVAAARKWTPFVMRIGAPPDE